jgi:hypothetical protein
MEVLVRVQAPNEPLLQTTGDKAPQVTPQPLSLVVGRSGSMHSEPIKEALAYVKFLVERSINNFFYILRKMFIIWL